MTTEDAVRLGAESADGYLEELMLRYQLPADNYFWANEESRWRELVFAIFSRSASPGVPPDQARRAVNVLFEMDKLRVKDIAEIVDSESDAARSQKQIIDTVLQETGYSKTESERAITTVSETAQILEDQYEGKPQRYLRRYGQLILDEVPELFQFSNFDDKDAKYAVTLWLQNVMSMPLTLHSREMSAFCKQYEVTVEELVEAADEQDLNLSILDDLVAEHIEELEAQELQKASDTQLLNFHQTAKSDDE